MKIRHKAKKFLFVYYTNNYYYKGEKEKSVQSNSIYKKGKLLLTYTFVYDLTKTKKR